jgi:hypothetical protein
MLIGQSSNKMSKLILFKGKFFDIVVIKSGISLS